MEFLNYRVFLNKIYKLYCLYEKKFNNFMFCYNVENMWILLWLLESEKKWLFYFFYDIFFVFRKFCKIVNVKKYYLMEMYGIIKFFIYWNIWGNFDVCWILYCR